MTEENTAMINLRYSIVEDCDEANVYEVTINPDISEDAENNLLVNTKMQHWFVSYWKEKLEEIFNHIGDEDLNIFHFRIYEKYSYLFNDITDQFGMSVTDYINGKNDTYIKYVKEVSINDEA